MKKNPWELSWPEWVDYYESPDQGRGNCFLFAQRVGDKLGIPSTRGEPNERGINSRERWYKAIIRWGLANGKNVATDGLTLFPDLLVDA